MNPFFKKIFCSLLLLFALFSPAMAEQKAKMLIAGCHFEQIALIDKEGKIIWTIPFADEVSDAVLLPNGNIIHSYKTGGVRELKPDYKSGKGAEVVWEWKTEPVNGKKGEIHSCQPLPGNKVLIGESHDNIAYLREVDRKSGKTIKTVELRDLGGAHTTFRQVRKTPQGTYLVTQQRNGGQAREFDGEGKLLRTFPAGRYVAVRLPNRNTLIACGDDHRLIEVTPDDKIVWEVTQNDIPGVGLGFIAGVQRLPNGNTVLTNWGGHGGSTGAAIIEITPDKKKVWESPPEIKNRVSTIHVVESGDLINKPIR